MDEILTQFRSAGLNVNPQEKEETRGFESLYKNWGKLSQQEQRRKDMLDFQRSNRNTKFDICRGILDIVQEVEEQETIRKSQSYRPSIYVAGFTKASPTYKDVLMMSEWLVEKPEDFSDNWYVIPCPKGVRTLIVACHGNTKFYTKYGSFRLSCVTALPGGNPEDTNSNSQCVVLDGFHVEATNTIYLLDLLAWNSLPMSDGETEFRHYWMKTHIEDIPLLKTINYKNKILFDILPKVDCTRDDFNKFMMTMPHFKSYVPALDGLLFYHKMAHYVSGITPLVGWLYPFMVNEVLGTDITVNPGYLVDRPIGYLNQARFIQEFEARMEKRAPSYAKPVFAMETTTETEEPKQKNGRHRKHKSRRNADAEMEDGTETNVWQPSTNDSLFWNPQTETIKPRITKIRPGDDE